MNKNDSQSERKAEAEYALAQMRAKGVDALDDPRVQMALAQAWVRLDRFAAALRKPLT